MISKARVLIGYDGSECSDAAIQDLRRAGLPQETEALVMTVADTFPHLPPSVYAVAGEEAQKNMAPAVKRAHDLAAQALRDAEETAKQGADRVRAVFPTWTVGHAAGADSPYREIVQRADRWRPDLLVVGSHGRSALGRAMLGSVAQNVLHHAICSVRIARLKPDVSTLQNDPVTLVLGVDGSADCAIAISALAGRAWPAGTKVHAIAAIDLRVATIPYYLNGPAAMWSGEGAVDDRSWAHRAVEGAARELRDAGLDTQAAVIDGDPKNVLVSEAERLNADCIFLGARGHSRMERFLLGSVSSAVAARAHCSVEVVRQS